MPRSPVFRLIAATAFVLVAFAVPGDAMAHGLAHHQEHERNEQQVATESHRAGNATTSIDHADEHRPPRVDGVAPTRVEAMTFVGGTIRVPRARVRRVAPAAPLCRAEGACGDRATGPPPRLRAPPVS